MSGGGRGIRRREFITLLGGAAAWPPPARAQQPERMRRIGALMNRAADDPDGQARLAAFQHGLQQLGWTDGSNVRIDTRWGEDEVDRQRRDAAELVALAPDIVLASGTGSMAGVVSMHPPGSSRCPVSALTPSTSQVASPPNSCVHAPVRA